MAGQAKKRHTRRYSPEERARALALAAESGPLAAGRELGILGGTITCWRCVERRKAARSQPVGIEAAYPAPLGIRSTNKTAERLDCEVDEMSEKLSLAFDSRRHDERPTVATEATQG